MNKIARLPKIKLLITSIALLSISFLSNAEESRELISWETKKLSADFYGEGAYHGDFNKDGAVDVVSGPYWYEGPDLSLIHI